LTSRIAAAGMFATPLRGRGGLLRDCAARSVAEPAVSIADNLTAGLDGWFAMESNKAK
jgi:hypothetical protein